MPAGAFLTPNSADLTTPNITPDRATGIGGWSEADFVRAMRWGIAPDDFALPAGLPVSVL